MNKELSKYLCKDLVNLVGEFLLPSPEETKSKFAHTINVLPTVIRIVKKRGYYRYENGRRYAPRGAGYIRVIPDIEYTRYPLIETVYEIQYGRVHEDEGSTTTITAIPNIKKV